MGENDKKSVIFEEKDEEQKKHIYISFSLVVFFVVFVFIVDLIIAFGFFLERTKKIAKEVSSSATIGVMDVLHTKDLPQDKIEYGKKYILRDYLEKDAYEKLKGDRGYYEARFHEPTFYQFSDSDIHYLRCAEFEGWITENRKIKFTVLYNYLHWDYESVRDLALRKILGDDTLSIDYTTDEIDIAGFEVHKFEAFTDNNMLSTEDLLDVILSQSSISEIYLSENLEEGLKEYNAKYDFDDLFSREDLDDVLKERVTKYCVDYGVESFDDIIEIDLQDEDLLKFKICNDFLYYCNLWNEFFRVVTTKDFY